MQVGIYFGESHPENGGAHTFLAELLRAVAEIGSTSKHQFIVLCEPAAAHGLGFKIDSPTVKVVHLSKPSLLSKCFKWLKYYSPLFRFIGRYYGPLERVTRRYGIQLLWFVGGFFYECPDMPFVATILDFQHRYQPFFPESAMGEWDRREQFCSYFLRRAAYCVTGTETGKRETKYLYQIAEERIRVLPLPTPKFALDAPPSVIDVRSRFGIGNKYIFYPAQFWPHKNHINLILALKWLQKNKNLEIMLILTGSDKGNLSFVKKYAEQEGMSDKIRFLGFVSEEELIALYRQAVALTFVTYFGPDNIPPLEAFALGCPVIASAVAGAEEQYGDAVVRVNPSDPKAMGQAIWNVYSDEMLRLKLIKAGFDRARKWTSVDYVREMFKLFDEFSAVRRNWL